MVPVVCFIPGKSSGDTDLMEPAWAPKPTSMFVRYEKSLTRAGNRTIVPQSFIPYPSHYTDWTIPAPINLKAYKDKDL